MKTWRPWAALAVPALVFVAVVARAQAPTPEPASDPLDQGWTVAERTWWGSVSQGSRLIPLAWLRALEQPGGDAPFLEPAHIARFGYLLSLGAPNESLPVGFAIDRQPDDGMAVTRLRWKEGQGDDEPWVGMNCAACHTAELTVRGRRVRIEGGPTKADFQGLLASFDLALRETRADPDRLARFAERVGTGKDERSRALLSGALDAFIAWRGTVDKQSATTLAYGPGRLDAVGHILNKVALVVGAASVKPWPADAPVSYPFIWNAPQHDRVQWNGIAENDRTPVRIGGEPTDFGALGRNTGEVIGVFGDVAADSFALNGFGSSIRARNLVEIERLLGRLRSPAWPLEQPDPGRVARGRDLFERKCEGCHRPLDRTDLATRVEAKMSMFAEAGTDIWMACNAWAYSASAGLLDGVRVKIFKGDRIAATDTGARLLTALVTGTLIGKADTLLGSLARDVFTPPAGIAVADIAEPDRLKPEAGFPDDARKRTIAKRCLTADDPLLAYKARPLNGIWATAPYLHNGSVPTLYDLLLPSDMRPLTVAANADIPPGPYRISEFIIGTRDFDPIHVGLPVRASDHRPLSLDEQGTQADQQFRFRTRDDVGQEILGNSNAGHDYGNSKLSDDERMALIEYMKTL